MDTKVKYTDSAKYKCLEYLKKNSVELYLTYCGKEICEAGHTYGPATRSEYLLHYIIDGKGSFTANGSTYSLTRHDSFLILPEEITSYTADAEHPWTYIWLAFNGTKTTECLHHAGFSETQRVNHFTCEETLIRCVNTILSSHQLTFSNDLIRQSQLMYFLAAIISEHQSTTSEPPENEYPQQVYIDYALDYIEQNYHKNIKVSDIASYIGIDRSYLTKNFKKILNVSPQEYLLNFRMNEAASLLKSTNYPVNQIAAIVGYSDALTFSKAFKAKYGASPKLYRSSEEELTLSDGKYK